MIMIREYATWYREPEEGEDDFEEIGSDSSEETVTPDDWHYEDMGMIEYLAHRLSKHYNVSGYSNHPPQWRESAWFTVETYQHPYENKRQEVSIHVEGLTNEDGQQLLDTLIAVGALHG